MSRKTLFVERRERIFPYEMPNELHDPYEIYYLVDGERRYFIGDKTYTVEPGTLVFVPPNVIHRTLDSRQPRHDRILIQFPGSYLYVPFDSLPLYLEPFRSPYPLLRLGNDRASIEPLLLRMVDEYNGSGPDRDAMLHAMLCQLLLAAGRMMRDGAGNAESGEEPNGRLQPIVDHILRHYSEPLQLGELAAAYYFSPSHLSRLFKRTTGFQFSEFVQLVRIQRAQELLRTTDRKVSEIAEAAGFGNLSHFQHVFKKIVHCTPLQYRKAWRQRNRSR